MSTHTKTRKKLRNGYSIAAVIDDETGKVLCFILLSPDGVRINGDFSSIEEAEKHFENLDDRQPPSTPSFK
jgi:chromosome condensin MukBEF MukE localization factor